jgi:exosome complex component RRP43
LSDPDEFEESVCKERVMVCIKDGGKVAKIEKIGGLTDAMKAIPICIGRAKERYDVWAKMLN